MSINKLLISPQCCICIFLALSWHVSFVISSLRQRTSSFSHIPELIKRKKYKKKLRQSKKKKKLKKNQAENLHQIESWEQNAPEQRPMQFALRIMTLVHLIDTFHSLLDANAATILISVGLFGQPEAGTSIHMQL